MARLAFLSWAGLRGAVPIVLMTIPLAEGVTDSPRLFDVVFVMVVIYTLLTGPTLPLVARWLGVDRRTNRATSSSKPHPSNASPQTCCR